MSEYSVTIVFARKIEGFGLTYGVHTKLRNRMLSIFRSWKKNKNVYSIFIHEGDLLIGVWHNENCRIVNEAAYLV